MSIFFCNFAVEILTPPALASAQGPLIFCVRCAALPLGREGGRAPFRVACRSGLLLGFWLLARAGGCTFNCDYMIDKQALTDFIKMRIVDTDYFLVDVRVSSDNDIVVEVDSPEGVDIDFCIALNNAILEAFDRDKEDYSLEVGSAGLTAPFKVLGQYRKNIGQEVEVLTADGKKLRGVLDEADEEGFTIGIPEKVKKEGMKRPVIETRQLHLTYAMAKSVKPVLNF